MKRLFLYIIFFVLYVSCSSRNEYFVSSITDGNTVILSNGTTIDLLNVENDKSNIKILEHYLNGPVLLYDENNDEITKFSSNEITAVIYNSDGDCLNKLLIGIKLQSIGPPKILGDSIKTHSVVKFRRRGEMMIVPVILNGEKSHFIFDTGAAFLQISKVKADSLKRNGTLSNIDEIGKSQFQIATGGITEGTIINLSSVIIGNRELKNVQACVMEGQNVPLLLGQSVLNKFGNYSIDNDRKEITFR